MRLFKRHCSDTSPQLVSATPISQDGAASNSDANSSKNDKKVLPADTQAVACTPAKATSGSQKASSQGSGSNRKGISTWGRTVGRHLEHLKRSDSSEILSVSSRRRRWSPNRKSAGNADDIENGNKPSAELPKPKRISRVESLRNLFKSNDRNNNNAPTESSTRNVTIHEEDDTCSHFPMEKALSEGALKNVSLQVNADDTIVERNTLLQEKKKQLSRSIHDLQEQQRVLDFFLKNQDALKTLEGTALARETLGKARRSTSPKRRSGTTYDVHKNSISTNTRDFFSNIRRNLFSTRASSNETERTDAPQQCVNTGLEELMSNLRLGCDESGYDSDSTRAGADSPDSGKSVPAMLKPRSFSITSEDYHGVDLSLPVSTPQKHEEFLEVDENPMESSCLDDTVILNKSFLNDTVRTDMTALGSDHDDDTDSCDDDTFADFADFDLNFDKSDTDVENNLTGAWDTGLSKTTSSSSSTTNTSRAVNTISMESSDTFASNWTEMNEPSALEKKSDTTLSLSQLVKLQNMQKESRSQMPMKYRNKANSSSLNLLDNAASPCKDSPPAAKVCHSPRLTKSVSYYSPKKMRSRGDRDPSRDRKKERKSLAISKIERPVLMNPSTTIKTLSRRELKTVKLVIEKAGSIGISVERREAARPFYVIAKMDANGEAAKSKKFKIGDEIVRVCGRRLRGMTITEARSALRNCRDTVELQIAREPTYTFGGEYCDTGCDGLVRTRSDSEVWSMKEAKSEVVTSVNTEPESQEKRDTSTCKIVGALMKDGKNLSVASIEHMEEGQCEPTAKADCDQKMTGMRKFHVVRKRAPTLASNPRRATSLSMELLTITLEKGPHKKLGFTIVGGTNSNKGSMGIFVKDIMAGGQAAEEGTLRANDEILAINGISMDGLTHEKALQNFKNAKPGKIILHVGRRDPTHKRSGRTIQ